MENWMDTWAIRNLLAELLMPPGIWVVLVLLALFLLRKHRAWQKGIIVFALIMVWVSSTLFFSIGLTKITDPLMHWPEPLNIGQLQKGISFKYADLENLKNQPAAIVILGGGRRKGAADAPEYGCQDISKETMERLRFGAKLAKHTGLPVLVTGGKPDQTANTDQAEAVLMSWVLQQELGVNTSWVEDQSATTQENALLSTRLLQKQGIKHIYLVTHFWHMPRAANIFEHYGLKVTPAPHGYESIDVYHPGDFYPKNIDKTRQIWHEILGVLWYKLRY
jgi:uncharacterized SAM-binding protein YcdF (DUF218 family)